MNTISKLIAIAVIGVLILAGLPTLQSEETEEYYEVTRYNMRGFTYDKEIIKVSKEDAEEIKRAFEGIDASLSGDKIERKRDVLAKYNLILSDMKPMCYLNNDDLAGIEYDAPYALIMSAVEGTLGPSFFNILHVVLGGPFLFSIANGIDFEITGLTGTGHLQIDGWVQLLWIAVFGVVLIIPFFSPSGYVQATVIFGAIKEL